jgi:hypothetical protein
MNFTAAVVAMAETAAAVVTGLDDAFVTAWDSTDVLSPINKDEEEVEEVQEVE